MLEVATLIVSIAMLILAAVVPFLSVLAAQRLVCRDAMRRDARDAFLSVKKHIQDYRLAFLKHYMNLTNNSPDVQQSATNLQEMVTALNGDYFFLGLVFDKKADTLGSRVQQLAGTAQVLFSDSPPPTFEKCEEGLKKDIQAISEEIKPLWDSLRRP